VRILSILIASVLILAGLYYLINLFFIQDGSETKKEKDNESSIEKVQSMIQEVEKKNPEQVAKIRNQFMAETQIKSARESEPEDVSGVIKHWISDKDEGDQK